MTRILGTCMVAGLALAGAAAAQAQVPPGMGANMPEARQMSGTPLPAGDVPAGTLVVRVVRGSMANPIAGQPVELTGGPTPQTATTDDTGRATFSGLPPGAHVHAATTVDGERIESKEIDMPAAGGIRVALVALDPEAAKRAEEDRKLAQAPAISGIVVLGEESRFVIEMGEEGLNVFNIMEVVNTARVPVQTAEPLVFDLPGDAQNAAVLEGSSQQAQVNGQQVRVTGPFAPGKTLVQFAYALPLTGSTLTLEQKVPVAMNGLTVMAQKVGEMHLTSPQFAQHRDMPSDGQVYVLGQGPALKAGDTVVLEFTGLPHAPVWPRNLAIALAVLILLGGAWGSIPVSRGAKGTDEPGRRRLEAKREKFFAELTTLEEQHRLRQIDDDRYTSRRRDLIASLERIYAELDEEAAA